MTSTTAEAGFDRHLEAWRNVVLVGLLFAGVALYATLVGIVGTFEARILVKDLVTLGEAILLVIGIAAGYAGARRAPDGMLNKVVGSAISGLMAGSALSLLVLIGPAIDLREYLPNASPALYELLTGGGGESSFWVPALAGMSLGVVGGILALLPTSARRLLLLVVGAIVLVGLFASIVRGPWLKQDLFEPIARSLMSAKGLTIEGALVVAGAVVLIYLAWVIIKPGDRVRKAPAKRKKQAKIPMSGILLIIALLIPLPATLLGLPNLFSLGPFVASAVALIALYVLMGLGLNITLGLAGLLDLGFVAFFAVGAYTVGLLTSPGEYGIAEWPFWLAIPFAILAAMAFGLVLGLPILGIRGDYLAIATLAFGEIIAIMARSDVLKPWIGGPQGILNVPKPLEVEAGDPLSGPVQIYYIALICAGIIAFVAYRLRESRLGRAWVAIREDEDVAEALGINLVQTKSLAYMLGAAFAGLGGAVYVALFGAILPSAINLNVSILVVCIIVIGGMGSIPGVVLGAIFIIGLPELFREFSEYRFLIYGIALILIMHWRPEGLIPSKVGRQELHQDEDVPEGGPPDHSDSDDKHAPATGAAGGA